MDNFEKAFSDLNVHTDALEDTITKISEEAENTDIEIHNNIKDKERHKIFYGLTPEDRELAVKMSLVPESYRDASFDIDKIKLNLAAQYKKYKGLYNVYKFDEYTNVCNEILSTIRMHKLPFRSYIIGAPNGFGKSSFVNECLITLLKHGFRVAPYISLWELAQIRVDNEQRIMQPYSKFKDTESGVIFTESNSLKNNMNFKEPKVILGRYSYSEYINSDCLFVHFTDLISKDIESHTLYQLLVIRGAKGLPTIVTMSTSLEPYENDKMLRELVWDEIRTYDENNHCYDRVYHVSCYKRKNIRLSNTDENIDNQTGVVK